MSTKPLYDPPRVGGDVLSWCTKCKMDLAHVVFSMVGIRPAKVICKTCKSQHNFKAPAGEVSFRSASSSPRKAPAARKTTMRASEFWEQQMETKKAAPLLPYDVKQSFAKGEVIRHTQFGVGIVEEVRKGKIVVMFREGERVLIHELGKPGISP